MKHKQGSLIYYLLFAVICIIWGTTWYAIKVGINSGVPTFRGAGIRFLLVSVIFFIIIRIRKARLPRSFQELAPSLFLGVFYFFVPYALQYWSLNHIPSALTAVIYGSLPLVVIILSHFMLESERMTLLRIISAIIGFGGVAAIALARNGQEADMHFWAVVAMIIAVMSTAYCTAYTKRHVQKQEIVVFLGTQIFVGGVLLSITSLIFEQPFTLRISATGVLSILYLAIVGTVVGWTLWVFLISRMSPVLVSYVSFFIPVVALIVGIYWGGERFSSAAILGTVLIMASILLVIYSISKEYRRK